MSTNETKHMLPVYEQFSEMPTRYFSGMFQTPAVNFFSSQSVEIDIDREDEELAFVIIDHTTGYNLNEDDEYTNKEFKPPAFKEGFSLNSDKLLERIAGNDPFKVMQDSGIRSEIVLKMMKGMKRQEKRIRRSIEQMCAQVMLTGKLTLYDKTGLIPLYTLDYKPKATHFPTAGVAWDQATSDKIGDILSLVNVIRDNGLADPVELTFGETAMESAFADDKFMKRFETRRVDLGRINPLVQRGDGGQYRGTLDIGNYKLDVYTSTGRHVDPTGGSKIQYMDPVKVLVKANGRLDLTFGNIPNIGKLLGVGGTSILPEASGRFMSVNGGMDLHTNVWLTDDGEQIFGGVGSRPLPIPTAIDRFGALNTGLS